MEEKRKLEKQARTLYVVLAAMLVIIMVFSVITAVNKRRDKQNPPIGTDTAQTSESARETKPPHTTRVPVVIPDETKKPETVILTEKPADVDVPVEDEPVSTPRVYVMPTDGEVVKGYSVDLPIYSATMNDYRCHTGVDIYAEPGMPVFSFTDGVVKEIYNDPMMGVTVSVDHGDGLVSYYQNLSEQLADGIKVGASLEAGNAIGCVGETTLVELSDASHLHFEVRRDGKAEDPSEYLGALKQANAEASE